MKDEILNRQKEVNVVGLLDKFTLEFDQHYRNKLLSVASGKYDGVYSRRFKGQGKTKADGVGFKKPTADEQKIVLETTTKVGENLFVVPSITQEGQKYLVDNEHWVLSMQDRDKWITLYPSVYSVDQQNLYCC